MLVEECPVGQLKEQFDRFYNSLVPQGMGASDKPESWLGAFFLLKSFLQVNDDSLRQVVFLDELPWLDTLRSGFLQAFEGFWNTWGCHRKNRWSSFAVVLIHRCGNRLLNNHGGLYGRVMYEIKLSPFTLHECEGFYEERGVAISRYDIAQSYMVFGGVPYYMGYLEPDLSLAQNIDKTLFAKGAKLRGEFDRLFDSVLVNLDAVKPIVRLLYTKNVGSTRKEIVEKLGVSDGGGLSRNLNALIVSDFVAKYASFGLSMCEPY